MKIYAVIMAGGVGSRFWPRSREKHPKQLLQIFGDKTMIQQTAARLDGLVEKENIYVITSKHHKEEIEKQLPDVPAENVVAEPFGRNTAACIGVASLIVGKKEPDAVTVVLPADHLIGNVEVFKKTIMKGAEFAHQSKGLVTIGIPPSSPETGYGYIQIEDNGKEDVYKVATFAEKPNYATAVRFLESGDFMWNSGMFIWRTDTILEEMDLHMPELHDALMALEPAVGTDKFDDTLYDVYGKIRSISIDYGIMEKSTRVHLIKGEFTWSDVGSWEVVYQLSDKDKDGNVNYGNVFSDMTRDSYIYSPDKFASVIGVDNLIVINTKDALLVCRRDKTQDVKKVVEHLKLNKQIELL